MNEVVDCVLACDGGVGAPESDVGEEKMADLGRPVPLGVGEAGEFLAKGLLRRCAALLALKAILRRSHPRPLILW